MFHFFFSERVWFNQFLLNVGISLDKAFLTKSLYKNKKNTRPSQDHFVYILVSG